MSRSALSLFLALILFVGFTATTMADVTGSFDIHISLEPNGNQTEATTFDIDFQSNLQVNITLSGLTFGADIGFGVTGIEFAVLSLDTNLGALALNDTFVFATPFYCASGLGRFCAATDIQDAGDVLFVKKRVTMELNIAGITMNNLAIFEDVDFPGIGNDWTSYGGTPDLTTGNSVPTFGFGDILKISGQTVSGISVTNTVGICADPQVRNRIKKRSWAGSVDANCLNDATFEGNAVFAFTVEKIDIEGVEVGGLTIDSYLEFRPSLPVEAVIVVDFSVAGLADVEVIFDSTNVTNLTFDTIEVVVSADNLTLDMLDLDADLQFDVIVAVFSVTLNPNQNNANLTIIAEVDRGAGLTFLEPILSISRSGLSLTVDSEWGGFGPGVDYLGTTFSLSATAGALNFSADIDYSVGGLTGGDITVGIEF